MTATLYYSYMTTTPLLPYLSLFPPQPAAFFEVSISIFTATNTSGGGGHGGGRNGRNGGGRNGGGDPNGAVECLCIVRFLSVPSFALAFFLYLFEQELLNFQVKRIEQLLNSFDNDLFKRCRL